MDFSSLLGGGGGGGGGQTATSSARSAASAGAGNSSIGITSRDLLWIAGIGAAAVALIALLFFAFKK